MPIAAGASDRDAGRTFRILLVRSVVMPFLVMALLATLLLAQIGRLRVAAEWVEHTDRVLATLDQFELEILDMQSSVRGFLYTRGDAAMLGPFDAARARVDATFGEVRTLTADRAAAQRQLAELAPRYRAYVARLDARLADGRAGNFELAANFRAFAPEIAELRASIRRLRDEESALQRERSARADREAKLTTYGAGGSVLVAGLLFAFASSQQLRRLSRTYERSLRESSELAATLEQRVEERTAEVVTTNAQLGEANKELEAFAYSVSHDLRAPMRHITGFAQLLRASATPNLSADDIENVDTILNTAVLAGRMVDDLLNFSRVGRIKMRRSPVDMDAIVKQSIAELEPELARRSVVWHVEPLPPAVGDPALIKMVWQNLLANAVKYTAKVSPARIEIGVTEAVADGSGRYFVRDNGVGFDMAYAHKLFGVFQRLHRAEDFEGTGIGLANVRRIIVRHEGEVWAEGRLGAGATFSFTLPDRPPAATMEAEADP